jgi:hypothetical protein
MQTARILLGWAGLRVTASRFCAQQRGFAKMSNLEALQKAVEVAQEAVGKQGDTVRSLKAELKDGKVDRVSGDRIDGVTFEYQQRHLGPAYDKQHRWVCRKLYAYLL